MELGYRSLKHIHPTAPSSLSSPHKCVSEQVQGSLHFGFCKCTYPNLPILVTSHLPHGIISCNCLQMNINHIFWPEQLLEWSPNIFFLTFCYFFSVLLLYYIIPLTMKFIPPSPISNFGVLSSIFPDASQSCWLGWLCHSSAGPLPIPVDSSSPFAILHPFKKDFHCIIHFSSIYRKIMLRGVKEQSK